MYMRFKYIIKYMLFIHYNHYATPPSLSALHVRECTLVKSYTSVIYFYSIAE